MRETTTSGGELVRPAFPERRIGLLTGGIDRPYALGLATALLARGLAVDFIASNNLDSPELRLHPALNFLNLRGDQREQARLPTKVYRILRYYARLVRYASACQPALLHILWNNKFEFFDRTILMLYYKFRGKKVALTAHNVNAGKRDSRDSWLNRLGLAIQYRLADHIFVHTPAMKRELLEDFSLNPQSITVIPLGLNNSVPDTGLTSASAKRTLGLELGDKAILFFGRLAPYKGIDVLLTAFSQLVSADRCYRLLIVGKPRAGAADSFARALATLLDQPGRERVMHRFEFVPDAETELYFKAADVLVLPYTQVYQSGVLILGYRFGLPVIAADVGSLRDDIVEGQTGFICRPNDPRSLASTIAKYFDSELFGTLSTRRHEIYRYARERYSWDSVSLATCAVYRTLLAS